MPVILETPRLILRPFRDSDIGSFLAYRNDPNVYRYQGWKTPFLRADALEFIDKMKSVAPGTPGEWYQLAIECRDATDSGAESMIGDVAFHITRSNPRMAYIGYSLAQSAWKHGYASEAVRKLLDYMFRVQDLHRVVADCDVDNLASINLLERLGFRREAHYIESFWMSNTGTWGSEYLFALLQREWILR
ncbi:MAG: GNAT family N-acetyltransferase [Chloroflexi bacterium]|nr:GNAT family N-acetyltransferase [Chloroflexota bacterium]